MALVLGTSSGFVTVAPTADPGGNNFQARDRYTSVTKDASPSGTNVITEIGFYAEEVDVDLAFKVALYSDSTDDPEDLLYESGGAQTGTTDGWKVISGLNWAIDATTDYWIGVQIENQLTGDFVPVAAASTSA